PEWARIWQHYSGGKIAPAPVLLSFNDGAQALLPLSAEVACGGLVRTSLSSPAWTYGGWLSGGALGRGHVRGIWEYLRRAHPNLVLCANPYNPATLSCGGLTRTDDVTHAVALDMPFEQIEQGWQQGYRRAVRKAAEKGVTARLAFSESDWEAYGAVYRDSLRRWGERASSRYRPALFEFMRSLSSPRIKLWLAEYRGAVVAGALCLCSRRHVMYWHGAAREDHFHLNPVKYLFREILRAAAGDGYAWFDFLPSGGHAGVLQFKRGFNPHAMPCPVFTAQTPAKRLYGFLAATRR
ncbi:MAG: GNAT family N-acetyltransferase, partial [Endomicrobiales bacterium]